MTFNLQFNAAQVAPNMGPELVPTGIYTVAIVSSEEKGVQGKPGCTYYELKMQILEGDQKGKHVFERLNCKNDNQQAVDIAYGTLSTICHVAGVMQVGQSSAELHNKPFKVSVVKEKRTDDPTKERNEIRAYYNMAGQPPVGGAAQPAAAPAQAAAFAQQQPPQGNGQMPAAVAAQPTQFVQPSTPAIPQAPMPAAAPPAVFPPEGWQAHPQAPGYFYKGQEVLNEAQLRQRMAPTPPAIPAAPMPPSATPSAAASSQPGQVQPAVPSWAQP